MASRGTHMNIVLVLLALLSGGAMAQSSCTSALTSLAPCLNYVTGNSTNPSSTCCAQLGNVVQASPLCLCSLLNGNVPSLGIQINQTLALSLPGACKVQTPPVSQCKAANAPTGSVFPPASSPAEAPAGSTSGAPEPSATEIPSAITPSATEVPSASGSGSATGSKTVPTTGGTSDGSITKASLQVMLLALFIAFCGSTVARF
ncbi:hypothetical protein Tsubulata_039386 [Turnera subulata]|uniref:Bifunctional inhibitor/plant lipid transfer protein/seed storage helical domain-containing protein n=1 Tax=Turnera subulata TaxID=218843 RepID=A0A9Q0JJX3_9ROSI|nr:hypothetical protein Tsubulata_039386 [Turnera subulata]